MRRAVAAVLAGLSLALVACSSDDGGRCGPFGNAPAKVVADQYPGSAIPLCAAGRLLGPWKDGDGRDRYACLYEPLAASALAPLPLVVFIHPSLFPADTLETATNILAFQPTTSLSDDPTRLGFIVIAPQGRSTEHFYPSPDDRGLGWDNWYRQLDPAGDVFIGGKRYVENVDAATIDHFVDVEVKTGKVDANRIFVTGWSNGAAMTVLYGLSRPNVAAIAPYSSPDPFHAFNDPCPQRAVASEPDHDDEIQIFNERLPTYHVHNDCDIVGLCPNGERMAQNLRAQSIGFEDVLIDSAMLPAPGGCIDLCGTNPDANFDTSASPLGLTLGSANHTRWPHLWTGAILEFLRSHPLDAPRP